MSVAESGFAFVTGPAQDRQVYLLPYLVLITASKSDHDVSIQNVFLV